MEKGLSFTPKDKEELREFILNHPGRKTIFNFLNLYSVYLYRKVGGFRKALEELRGNSLTLVDSSTISFIFRAKRIRGTDFTIFLMGNQKLLKKKKHFFLGSDSANDEDIKKISQRFNLDSGKVFYYNPPYIKGNKFSKKEIQKITNLINENGINYLWVGIGNPKQEILASEIYHKINVNCIFNVGAALDFITGKKKEAPKIVRKLGLEWLYRGVTDFKHSRKKVLGSFLGLMYLPRTVKMRKN
ncbi:WecB/TagA/CpsF family glycosyltransferase [Candidatus Pacearchaeota archaeon]|nr:WecB/TagA/CpsF family glycosyltransferase [Candidatus Pacearchaeota archaeon]